MSARSIVVAMMMAAAWGAGVGYADDRTDYNRRAAARDVALFQALDRNGDGRLTRDEARGDLELGPRFEEIDINRDGVMTPEELQRYIEQRYGIRYEPPLAARPAS